MSIKDASLDLDSKFLGALPIVNHFLARLQVEVLLERRLPPPDPRSRKARRKTSSLPRMIVRRDCSMAAARALVLLVED